ncbi:MAG: 30S ribosomal protein S6 [Bacteroidota bacterium]
MADATAPATGSIDPMYELMYIINPVLNEDQIKDIVQRVTQYLSDNGASVANVEETGSQRLAYPIEKKRNGYYVVVNFRLPKGANSGLLKIERALNINDDIMRHLVLKYDAKMERYYEAKRTGKDLPKLAPPVPRA